MIADEGSQVPGGSPNPVTESAEMPAGILERICRENLAVYRESEPRLQEDVSQESQVAHDYRGRLVYELLQNADDALAGSGHAQDHVLFRLTDAELWVANTGRPFTEADVRGLCGLGASSKTRSEGPKRASIGHKGLGFKSVLEITDSPEAFSESVSFRLGSREAEVRVGQLWRDSGRGPVRGVPAMRFPTAISADDAVWTEFHKGGFRSAFRFPFHERVTDEQREALALQLLSLPMTSVLFLKHLEEVVIEVDVGGRRRERQWLLDRRRFLNGDFATCDGLTESGLYRVDLVNRDGDGDRYWMAHDSEVTIGPNRDGLSGPAWDGIEVSEVSVAVRDSDNPEIDPKDRRFHVFLPTQEPVACSILVNGAFTTDLSRQQVRVSESSDNYNGFLIRRASEVFAQTLLPLLLELDGPGYVLRILDQDPGEHGPAAQAFNEAMARAIGDVPFLPSRRGLLPLNMAVLPAPVLGEFGSGFASLLTATASVEGRYFPDSVYCRGDLAFVSSTFGAIALSPTESMRVLARQVDSASAVWTLEQEGRYWVDPVLEMCVHLWERADASDRQELEEDARMEELFPVGENDDGTVRRIRLGDESAFYPPRSSAEELPLRRLRFLAHAVCWGTLGRTEQRSVLEGSMRAWDALFEIKEFRFEEVMRAAVLPGLTRSGTADPELREANRTVQALATICRLAGKTTKPDQPLPMGRLGSDRAFFNLSRLEVPCRVEDGEEPEWLPVHQVYFGRDWVGDDSVEAVADAMAEAGASLKVRFLAPPGVFAPYATAIGVHEEEEAEQAEVSSVADADEGEVDLDDDTDEALETTVQERWRNFFAWLGVSRGLRLIHFHDVDDSGTGWTSTKNLVLPGGWAFGGLDRAWLDYRSELIATVGDDPRWATTDHYLYQVHNLDHLDEIVAVARRSDNDVASSVLAHLVRNWSTYAHHAQAQLAFVGAGKWPSSRTAPPRAAQDELVTAGADFWLYRLRQHAICPTSRGPRRPNQTWRRSEELIRRLGRGGREAGAYLPVLTSLEGVQPSALRSCLDELQVRGELTPAAFTIEDGRDLCVRVSQLFASGVSEQALRSEIRPVYRQMFELLARTATATSAPLTDAPLAAITESGITFMPAHQVVYASVSGSRERSGVQGRLPLFVLEAEPGALRPLRELFGTPFLETALEWSVSPGEPALDDTQLVTFRNGLRQLIPPLLARLSADRADRSGNDRRVLQAFAELLEPVESLTLDCSFQGTDLGTIPHRTYFVSRETAHNFPGLRGLDWTGVAAAPGGPSDAGYGSRRGAGG